MTDYKELIKKMDAERDIARAYGRLQSTPGLEDTAIDQPGTAKTILQVPSIEAGKKKSYEDLSLFEKIVNALELGYAQRNVSQSFGDAVDYFKIAGEGAPTLVNDFELDGLPDYAREGLSKALSNPNSQANKEWRKKYEKKARESFYDSVKWQAKLNNYATPKAFLEANEAVKGMDFNSESVGKWLDKAGQDSLGVALYLAGTSTGAIAPELADLAVTSAITGGRALPVKATKLVSRLGQVYNTLSMAKGSYNNEFGSFLRDRLDELKIDTTNEQAMRDFFQQDERAQEILNNAQRRAAVVATFDAVGAGFAPHSLNISNSVRMARDATKLVKEHGLGFGTALWMSSKSLPGPSSHLARFGQSLENLGIQTSMQAGLGMTGEALGSVVSGQKINVGDVLAEGFGEWAGSFHEVAASMGHHAANYVIEEGNARQAKKINEQLVQLNNAINAIGQQINDNYTVETWANEVGKDKNVFAFAQDLVESGTVEKVRDVNPELADKIVAAAEERRDVAIPVNDVLSIAAKNSDLANSLVYDSRTTIDGMSPRQADKFFEEGKDELVKSMMKMIDDAKPTIQIRDEAQQAANGLKKQLVEAGTDERVADVQVVPWQAYLVRRATDLGTTPSALMKQMNIRVEDGRVVQRTSFGQDVVAKKSLIPTSMSKYNLTPEAQQAAKEMGVGARGKKESIFPFDNVINDFVGKSKIKARKVAHLLKLMSTEHQQSVIGPHKKKAQIHYQRDIYNQIKAAEKEAGVDLSDTKSPITRALIVKTIVEDTSYAVAANSTAIGWYDKSVREMFSYAGTLFPELDPANQAFDPDKQFVFIYILATTSNGLKVNKNLPLAVKNYEEYRKTGVIPAIVEGSQSNPMKATLEDFPKYVAMFGSIANMRKFFMTQWTVSQMKQMGVEVNGEAAGEIVRGASMIGPKIGNGFFVNLYGIFDALTMDRWFMRTFSRYNGTLVEFDPKKLQKAVGSFRQAAKRILRDAKLKALIKNETGIDVDRIPRMSDSDAQVAAQKIHEYFMPSEVRSKYADLLGKEGAPGDKFRKSASGVIRNQEHGRVAPRGASERSYIRSLFNEGLNALHSLVDTKDLTMADNQASLWYSEKRIYENLSKGEDEEFETDYNEDEAPDYSNVMRDLALSRGVSQQTLTMAKDRVTRAIEDEQAGRTQRNSVDTIAPKDKARAFGLVSLGNLRTRRGDVHTEFSEQSKALYQGKRGLENPRDDRSDGSDSGNVSEANSGKTKRGRGQLRVLEPVDTWTAGSLLSGIISTIHKLKGHKQTKPPVFEEFGQNEASVAEFLEAFIKAKESQGAMGAAVETKSVEELLGQDEAKSKFRFFLSEDRTSGFAIKNGDDLVSVFSLKGTHSMDAIVQCAIAAGARRLDCYNTFLVPSYAKHGFVPVARVTFNQEFAPKDWSKEAFAKYQNGEPDVVFMVLDDTKQGTFEKGSFFAAPLVESYEKGEVLQQSFVEKFKERNKHIERILKGEYTPEQIAIEEEKKQKALKAGNRYQFGLSIQMSKAFQGVDFIPSDADMARIMKRIEDAISSTESESKKVLSVKVNPTIGVYGGNERSFDIEVITQKGYDPRALYAEIARIAHEYKQDSALLSRVVRNNEDIDYKRHRPGVEILFKEARSFEESSALRESLGQFGVNFYTTITEKTDDKSGAMPKVTGVRFQFVPEFDDADHWAAMSTKKLEEALDDQLEKYQEIVDSVLNVDGVLSAETAWFDTQVLFSEDYEEFIDEQTREQSEGDSGVHLSEETGQGQEPGSVLNAADAQADRKAEETGRTGVAGGGTAEDPSVVPQLPQKQRKLKISSDIRTGSQRAIRHREAQDAQSFAQQEVLMQNGWDDSSGSTQPPISAPARRGSYSPMNAKGVTPGTGGVIQLMEKADKSTFLHESAHAWLDMDTTLALSLAEKVDRGEPLTQGEKSFLRNLGGFFRWGTQEGVLNFNITDEQSVLEAVRQWSMFTPDEQRGMHELFARGFESYLMQGSAPVSYMGKAFRRFKSWLMSIYQEATNEPKPISKEVKKLYDLMFASEQQAIQAEEKVGLKKLFSGDQKKLSEFMTPEELAEYEELAQEAEEEARNLLAKAIKTSLRLFGAISKATKKMLLSSYKNRVDEREKAILQEPRYRAVAILQEGIDQGDGTKVRYTINRNSLLSAGVSEEVVDMLEQRGWATDAMGDVDALTVPAAAFAELAGTKDVSDLMSDLVDIENLEQAREEALNQIAVEVEQETGQKFASFTENTADLAVHSDLRNRLLIAEYNALVRRLGGRQLLVSAAREYAAEVIGRMTVSELRPSIFESAEKRCAREAENAFLRGDLEACVEAKRGQVLNHQLARAAREARETYKRGASIARMAKRSKTMHKPYQFVLVRLLDQHSMSNMTREERRIYNAQETETSAAIAGIVKQLEDAGTPIDGLETFINSTKHVNDMTVDEMQNFIEVLSQLSRLGHNVYTQNLTQLKTSVGEVIDEGAKLLHKAADEQGRGYNDDSRIPTTKKEVVKEKFRQFFLGHLKMSTICRIFDQNKDGGFFWNLFIRSANERSTFETAMRQKASLVLQEKFVPVFKKGPDEDPIHIPGFDKPFTHGMRLIVALNWGNESNRQRITGGDPNFTPQAIQTILGSLTEADWKAVEAIWQLFESFKPLIAAKEKRVFGVEPEWVKYEPFTVHTSDGKVLTVSGGYYPVKYDPKGDNKAAIHDAIEAVKQEMQGAFQSATTRRSFTKSRVEKVFMPVRLDFAGLYDGLNDVIHDLAWHEWLIDTKRVLDGVDARQQGLRSVIATRYGSSVAKMFDDWRKDIATGGRDAANTLRLVINCFSKNVGLATMGYSATSAVVQLTGIGYAVPRVGLWGVAHAITRFMTNPVRVMREAKGKSEYMRLRNTTQIKEVSQIKNRLDRGKFSIQEHAYCMIQVVQGIVDFITWDGAYAKFLREGYSEADAVAMADQTVDDTQSSGNLHSLSEVERAGFYRALGVFYSWANSALNLTVTEIKSERNRAKMLARLLWMSGLMPIFESMFRELLSSAGDDDDDDDQKWGKEDPALALIRKPLGEIVEYNMGLFLGLRELSNAAGNFVKGENIFQYKGPAAFGSIASIADTAAAVENNPTSQKAMRSYVSTAGYMFGLPASQLKRTMKGAQAIEQGKVDDAEALQALIFGYTGELDK